MDSKQSQQISKYLDLFSRRKVFIITILLLSLPVGLGIYLRTPKVYQTTSLLSYQQQKISPNKMSPDVSSRISDIVSTLSQIVISRTNLEKAIVGLNLYPEAREKMPIEDVITLMREKIEIKPMKRGDVFTVSFSGTNPGDVLKVTNDLAAKFIEENLKYRQERASETSSYTSYELDMARNVMDQKENAMRDYKLKHYYEMPEQRDSNVVRLIALQEQYMNTQGTIQELERTLVLISEQLSSRQEIIASSRAAADMDFEMNDPGADPQNAIGTSAQRLANVELFLGRLLLKYTDKHPEVKRTKKLIAKLEKEVSPESVDEEKENSSELRSAAGSITASGGDSEIMQLEAQKKTVGYNLGNIRREKDTLKKQIEQYEKWVSSAPIREAEWSSLTREYGQLKRHYDYLVSQDLQAKSMLNLERRQKGSQFKIEDPARYPSKPIKPDFIKIMAAAVGIGLALSCGLSFVIDVLDPSIRDGGGLEEFLGVPLIATIPYIHTEKELQNRKWRSILTICFLGCFSFMIMALFYYVWNKDLIVL